MLSMEDTLVKLPPPPRAPQLDRTPAFRSAPAPVQDALVGADAFAREDHGSISYTEALRLCDGSHVRARALIQERERLRKQRAEQLVDEARRERERQRVLARFERHTLKHAGPPLAYHPLPAMSPVRPVKGARVSTLELEERSTGACAPTARWAAPDACASAQRRLSCR